MYAAVQSEHVNAEKCQKHIIVFKNSQARNTTLSANVTGYVFFSFLLSFYDTTGGI